MGVDGGGGGGGKARKKKQEVEEARRRCGKTTSKNRQEWGLEIPRGLQKTGKGRKILLQRHL